MCEERVYETMQFLSVATNLCNKHIRVWTNVLHYVVHVLCKRLYVVGVMRTQLSGRE